jgi:hemoglobin
MSEAAREQNDERTLFVRIGGAEAVDRLVESFYGRMDRLPEARLIRDMHLADLGHIKDTLKRYLGEWLGGPKLYSAEKGHPRLRARHLAFKIGAPERDAWLLCMSGALEEAVDDLETRETIEAAFATLADWMRNQPGNPHDARLAQINKPPKSGAAPG